MAAARSVVRCCSAPTPASCRSRPAGRPSTPPASARTRPPGCSCPPTPFTPSSCSTSPTHRVACESTPCRTRWAARPCRPVAPRPVSGAPRRSRLPHLCRGPPWWRAGCSAAPPPGTGCAGSDTRPVTRGRGMGRDRRGSPARDRVPTEWHSRHAGPARAFRGLARRPVAAALLCAGLLIAGGGTARLMLLTGHPGTSPRPSAHLGTRPTGVVAALPRRPAGGSRVARPVSLSIPAIDVHTRLIRLGLPGQHLGRGLVHQQPSAGPDRLRDYRRAHRLLPRAGSVLPAAPAAARRPHLYPPRRQHPGGVPRLRRAHVRQRPLPHPAGLRARTRPGTAPHHLRRHVRPGDRLLLEQRRYLRRPDPLTSTASHRMLD